MLVLAAADSKSVSSVFVWCGVLVALLLLAFAGYTYFKRWMNQTEESAKEGFTLSDLRELHRQGKMSDAEFELTKVNMIGSAKKMAAKMPDVLPKRGVKPPVDEGGES